MFLSYFIGNSDLVIECMKCTLKKGHKVLGVVSNSNKVLKWAYNHDIQVFHSLDFFKKEVAKKTFDYLFSIVNYNFLDPEILDLPKKLAINYHDAPLPKYAGLYATTWALLNGEKTHGVTWHVMTSKIDLGEILCQAEFPILNYSAYQLNLKCYQEAICLFDSLIDNLATGQYQLTSQKKEKRTYFGLYKRPSNLGIIDWHNEAEIIARQNAALFFGNIDNPFLTTKVLVGNKYFVPNEVEVSCEAADSTPGKILLISPFHIKVATNKGALLIKTAKDFNGKKIGAKQIQENFDLKEGMLLRNTSSKDSMNTLLKNAVKDAIKNEANVKNTFLKGVDRLESVVEEPDEKQKGYIGKLNKDQINNLSTNLNISAESIVFSLICIYLYKTNNYKNTVILVDFDIENDRSWLGDFSPLFKYFKLLQTQISENDSLEQVLSKNSSLEKQHDSHIYFSDIFMRNSNTIDLKSIPIILWRENIDNSDFSLDFYKDNEILLIEKDTFKIAYHPAIEPTSSRIYTYELIKRLHKILDSCLNQGQITSKNYNLLLPSESTSSDSFSYDIKEKNLLLSRFKEMVQKFHNKTAISSNDKCISYIDLDKRSNEIAAGITQRFSFLKSQYVAVYLEDRINFIISIIGILKAGLAYVPISHEQPIERVQAIIEDIRPILVITDPILQFHSEKYPVCNIEDLKEKRSFKPITSDFEQVAYVIYTSGSTGKPKGVKVLHKNIARLFLATAPHFHFTYQDKWTLLHAMSFDFSVWEIWGCLLTGGELVLVPENIRRSPKDIALFIQKNKITVLNQTPVYFNQMIDSVVQEDETLFVLQGTRLRYIIFGGDKLDSERLNLWNQWIKNVKLINMYGITETTIHASFYKISNEIMQHKKTVPIGLPLNDLQFYNLDLYQQPIPPGLVGELYIAGDGLSLGYHNLPEKTKERFIELNTENVTKRLYRTGDRVLFSKKEHLYYFLGRSDHQSKIRGFRIELTEIDCRLLEHPLVRQSYTIIKTDSSEKKTIVSYIIPTNFKRKPKQIDLKNRLRKYLPDYMIPTYIICLRAFPLTTSYKIDTYLLPEPSSQEQMVFKKELQKNSLEKVIISIWEDVLGIKYITLKDNFFELGGHSLLLTEMLLKLHDVFNTFIDLQEFIISPTISHLKNLIEKKSNPSDQNRLKFIDDILLFNTIKSFRLKKIESSNGTLLTGSTGFLGLYLLKNLITKTTDNIYVLLRNKNNEDVYLNLEKSYQSLFGTPLGNNVIPVLGDLSQPDLGMKKSVYKKLAVSIKMIVHNAAQINHLLDYTQLRQTNVSGTLDLLKLANKKVKKSFHYVSTLSAAIEKNNKGAFQESFPHSLSSVGRLVNGYMQSKWISEMLLSQAHHQGMPVNIYRPSWITPVRKQTNYLLESNHLLSFLVGCMEINIFPMLEGIIDMVPVDFVADIIIGALESPYKSGYVFNCGNPNPIFWEQLLKSIKNHSHDVKTFTYESWKASCRDKIKKSNPLYRFLPFYLSHKQPYITRPTQSIIMHENLDLLMTYLGVYCPIISEDWLTQNTIDFSTELLSHDIV